MSDNAEETTQIITAVARPIEFLVEVSARPGAKSEYKLKLMTTSEAQARLYYRGLNVGRGFKKRLRAYAPSFETYRLLEREAS
jgi:hypothetical protein